MKREACVIPGRASLSSTHRAASRAGNIIWYTIESWRVKLRRAVRPRKISKDRGSSIAVEILRADLVRIAIFSRAFLDPARAVALYL